MKYIVLDQQGQAHLVESDSWGNAVNSIAGGISARIAHHIDIRRFEEKNKEKK